MKKIGVLTSGGDAPGMNIAIRAVVMAAFNKNIEVYGIFNGYKGLVEGDIKIIDKESVNMILNRGGTFLGSARLPEFKEVDVRRQGVKKLREVGIEALIVIGGDGSFKGAKKLTEMGINCIGIPGTIDNDISSTDYTIGFYTALNTAVDSIDKLRDTSDSHQRCSIVEVMGRNCGDLAINAGIATGAEVIITSETGFDKQGVLDELKEYRKFKRNAIVVITEHITNVFELAQEVEDYTGYETRATVLGHVQRGGSPTSFDRVLASRMGCYAVELLLEGYGGRAVGLIGNELVHFDILDALSKSKGENNLYQVAKNLK